MAAFLLESLQCILADLERCGVCVCHLLQELFSSVISVGVWMVQIKRDDASRDIRLVNHILGFAKHIPSAAYSELVKSNLFSAQGAGSDGFG